MGLTPEILGAMAEGRARRAEQRRYERAEREAAYTKWIREDARLYRKQLDAATGKESDAAHDAWLANLKLMPELP